MTAPITANPFQVRRTALRAELERRNLAGALITDPNHFFYLTGFLPNRDFVSFLALNRERAIAVTPQLGVETSAQVPCDEPVEVLTYANLAMCDLDRYIDEFAERDRVVSEAVGRLGLAGKPLGIDAQHFWRALGALLGLSGEKLLDVGAFLMQMRVVKDAWEQEQMAYAVRLVDVGFAETQRVARPGLSDLEVFSAACLAMAQTLGGRVEPHGEFSGGPDISGRGSAPPSGYILQHGDILTADIALLVRGYKADTTRNFVLGPPAAWQTELHHILEDALARGEAAIRPGLPAAELDKIVRGYILAAAPQGAVTFHHMGHGLGISVGMGAHHPPFIVPHSADILAEGMVLTMEPGLYIAGKGGMRLEDNYVVTKDGCRPLGTFPKKLAVCQG